LKIPLLDSIVKQMPALTMENSKLYIEPDTSRLLNQISRFLADKNIPAFIAGGFVRDMLLGRAMEDIDIAIDADALAIAREIATDLGATYVELDDLNRIGRVVLPGNKWQVDFTTLQGDIEQDLARRDFTIDAMAIELKKGLNGISISDIIDPFNGRADINHRIIRAVNDGVFADDPARLMRAARLAAELGFNIEDETERLIRENSNYIGKVAGERTREELLRLLALPGAGQRLFYLDRLGLLTALFPELELARGVEQPKIHVWHVFEHSIQTVSAVEFVLRESAWEFAGNEVLAMVPWSERLKNHFDRVISSRSKGRTILKLAALFHDIAKPQTRTMDEGRARFLGHPEQGAAITADIMTRLRFSNREIQLAALLVKYHLRPTQMSNEGLPTPRAVYRYFRDTGEAGIDLLYLCLADHLATRAGTLDLAGWQEHTKITEYILARHFAEESQTTVPKIIDGNDVMESLGLRPGPEVGELLEALREARATGEIATRAQALKYLKRLFRERAKTS
jgi:poly(A) polymerase